MAEQRPNDTNVGTPTGPGSFPIVGIGASAGGLDAFEQFFTHTPSNSGMAFVLVQHLDPNHESLLADLVARHTRMPVNQVKDGLHVQPNHVYVIPPNRDMALRNGQLHLMEPVQRRGLRLPIDRFFRSLAEDQKDRAICIVLSGTGSDGTLGLKAVKGEGGIVLAQAPGTATYDSMPSNAIATGLVDYVLPPEKMAEQLIHYAQHAFAPDGAGPRLTHPPDPQHDIFAILHQQTGHDFSAYKPTTLERRIARRMAVNQISRTEDYVQRLHNDAAEVETLFHELLISVTSFFRDPKAFEILEQTVIPQLFTQRPSGEALRVWVSGCATGEEAYAIAILLTEYMERHQEHHELQIFATDIDPKAIAKARTGLYPRNIAADVSVERLRHYFVNEEEGYRVCKRIRESVVFAVQSLIKDPPFSRLDLVSCRNLLIYLNTDLQERALALFHYALNPGGYLILGNSESLGKFANDFIPISDEWKIFQRRTNRRPLNTHLTYTAAPQNQTERSLRGLQREMSLQDVTRELLLEAYAPPCLIVNKDGDILYIHGHMGNYLESTTGKPSTNVLRTARTGLRLPLNAALRRAATKNERVVHDNLRTQINGDQHTFTLIVQPLVHPAAGQGLLQIIFEDAPPASPIEALDATAMEEDATSGARDQRIAMLEQELSSTREYLQTAMEALGTSNADLQSTNEELQSSNEELKTSKEELQSINEELVTVNNELKSKIDALIHANEDINNLLNSVAVGIIFLDRRLQIERFNPQAQEVINLIESDTGRPLQHLVSNLAYDTLVEDCRTVLTTQKPQEHEVRTHPTEEHPDTRWFLVRIQPYTTLTGDATGLVLTFADITAQKRMQAEIEHLRQEELRALVENNPDLVVRFDRELRHLYVNPAVTAVTGIPYEDYIGKTNRDLGMPEESVARWDAAILEIFATGKANYLDFEYEAGDEQRYFQARLTPEHDPSGDVKTVLSVTRDLTDLKIAEQERAKANAEIVEILESINDAFFTLDDDLTVTYFNQAAERVLRVAREEVLGRKLFDAFPTARGSIFEEMYRRAIREREHLSFEDYFDDPDYEAWYNVSVYPRETGISVYFQDITDRKQAENALRESEQRMELALKGANLGTWDWDITTGAVIFNQRWAEMLGYDLDEIEPNVSVWEKLLHPDDAPAVTEALNAHLEGRTPIYQTEQRLCTKSGAWRWILDTGKVFERDEQGNPLRAVGIHQDINERKLAEEKLQRAIDDFQRSNEELEQFGFVISHDLREPVRIVISYLNLLQQRNPDTLDEKSRLYIKQAQDGALRMREMIHAMLDLSRVGSRGKAFAPTDTGAVLERVVAMLGQAIEETGAEVTHTDMPVVMADEAQLAQVFQNLIANAIKFRRETVQPHVHIRAESNDDAWVFSVADNGIGLDLAQADRIFKIFQRLHTAEEYPGLGIGLALCKRIVERHGGRIWVTSTPGEGSTFTFTLPKMDEKEPSQRIKT